MPIQDPNLPGSRVDRVNEPGWGCGWAWIWLWLFVILILLTGWGWGGWWGGWRGPWGWWQARPAPPQATAPPVTAPGEFLGKTVTVTGTVDEVLGSRAFTLAGSDGGRELLVISNNEKAPAVKKGEAVQVTGTVEKYSADDIHRKTGADLTKVPSAEFAGRPALVASSVAVKSSAG